MSKLIKRAEVILGAAVSYILAAVVGLSAAAGELGELAPEGGETAVLWLVRAGAWLTGAVAVVRRVSEVAPAARGLLPPE